MAARGELVVDGVGFRYPGTETPVLSDVSLRIDDGERAWFAKLVRPDAAADLVRRHELLAACGLPVPELAGYDLDDGLVIMAELRGSTLRDVVKSDAPTWPAPNTAISKSLPSTGS